MLSPNPTKASQAVSINCRQLVDDTNEQLSKSKLFDDTYIQPFILRLTSKLLRYFGNFNLLTCSVTGMYMTRYQIKVKGRKQSKFINFLVQKSSKGKLLESESQVKSKTKINYGAQHLEPLAKRGFAWIRTPNFGVEYKF